MQTTPVSPTAEGLDTYLHLSTQEIARLVLYLMVEEGLRGRLASFRRAPRICPLNYPKDRKNSSSLGMT